jgi:hypothetical protein
MLRYRPPVTFEQYRAEWEADGRAWFEARKKPD